MFDVSLWRPKRKPTLDTKQLETECRILTIIDGDCLPKKNVLFWNKKYS